MLFFSWYAPIYAPFWWRDYAPNAFLCYHIMLVFGGNTSPMLNKVIKWEFSRVFSHSCSLYILLDHFLGVAAKAINTRKKCGKQSTNSGERTIPRRKILPHVGRGTYTCTYVHSFPRLETLGFPILRQSSRRGTVRRRFLLCVCVCTARGARATHLRARSRVCLMCV